MNELQQCIPRVPPARSGRRKLQDLTLGLEDTRMEASGAKELANLSESSVLQRLTLYLNNAQQRGLARPPACLPARQPTWGNGAGGGAPKSAPGGRPSSPVLGNQSRCSFPGDLGVSLAKTKVFASAGHSGRVVCKVMEGAWRRGQEAYPPSPAGPRPGANHLGPEGAAALAALQGLPTLQCLRLYLARGHRSAVNPIPCHSPNVACPLPMPSQPTVQLGNVPPPGACP